MKAKCCHCGTADAELRPYGPGGAPVCFDCGMKPENQPTTEAQLKTILDQPGPMVIDGSGAPRPLRGGRPS